MNATVGKWNSSSPGATLELGRAIGERLPGGTVLGLIGVLGAGKTLLVKGIAQGNGMTDPHRVTSPTFTLVNEYSGRLRLFHLDAYRLKNSAEFLALGFSEMRTADSAVIVEWADRVRSALPDDTISITIQPVGAEQREIVINIPPGSTTATSWLPPFVVDSGPTQT